MSTALSEPFYFDPHKQAGRQLDAARHLSPVPSEALDIRRVPSSANAEILHVSAFDLLSPAEQFAPDPNQQVRTTQSNLIQCGTAHEQEVEHRRQISQRNSIKKMTQTIGAAFVEAELGLRPFRQLGSWIEWELFHKLRARVERTASGQYLTTYSGSSKVPSIVPIGVRAVLQTNGDWETSMTIRVGQRARAVAMRLQLHRERWRVTAFEIG